MDGPKVFLWDYAEHWLSHSRGNSAEATNFWHIADYIEPDNLLPLFQASKEFIYLNVS
jgi:hypothetical protein